MLAAERRNRIIEKLQAEKKVVVADLSAEFDVSEETIRRDLDKLEREGIAIKSYGGATLNESNSDNAYVFRRKKNQAGKEKIASIIEKMVSDGEFLMVDSSTTAVAIVQALKEKKRLTIITNSVELLLAQPENIGWEVISTGGYFREEWLAMVGPVALKAISTFYVDKMIVSCKGFDMERGATDQTELFSQIKQGMIKSARTKILAVDHSKFDKISFSKICNPWDVDMIITDEKPSDEWMKYFKEHNIRCIYSEDQL